MGYQRHEQIRCLHERAKRLTLRFAAAGILESLDMRVVEGHLATALPQQGDHVRCRRVARIANVGLERDSDDADAGPLDGPAARVERLRRQLYYVSRHGHVYVARQLDEPVDEPELARTPGQVVRIDRNAVAADARTRPERHESEGFRGGRVDDLPHVQAHSFAQHRELVDQGDVDVAEDVLEQLGHLRGVGGGQLDHGSIDVPEQLRDPRCRQLRQPADQSRDVSPGTRGVAGVDALRDERQIEVPPRTEATPGFERLAQRAGGRAGVRRRLQDHELAATQPLGHESGSVQNVG